MNNSFDPTPITASLIAHAIDPSTAEIVDGRTGMGNGAITVTIRAPKPVRQAIYRAISGSFDRRTREWSLKIGGRYVEDDRGRVVEFASAGAALAGGRRE